MLTVDTSLGAYESWCLLWFYDAQSLSNFFKNSYPYMCCAIDEDDDEILAEIKEISALIKVIPPDDDIITELADFPCGATSMVWWGTFSDLCVGQKEIARKVRAEFRKPSAEEILYSDADWQNKINRTDPIQDSEVEGFVEFLNNLKNE